MIDSRMIFLARPGLQMCFGQTVAHLQLPRCRKKQYENHEVKVNRQKRGANE